MCKQSFDDLFIDRIEDIYMSRNPNIVSVDNEDSKTVAPEKDKLKQAIDDLDIEEKRSCTWDGYPSSEE